MTIEKTTQLNQSYSVFQQMLMYDYPIEQLDQWVVHDIMGYGTNLDEKASDINAFKEILLLQRDQAVGLTVQFITTPVFRRISRDENVAIYVDEITVRMEIEGGLNEFVLRISIIFEYLKDLWMLTHFHGSRAVDVTGDSWQKDIWKQKNDELQRMVDERTMQLQQSISELRSTQAQLIQSEKMASLGELTAGIAHEIQNPLNFVNNFSEVSNELLDEMKQELGKGNANEAKVIAGHVKQNIEKVLYHGKRADAIVKSMLQHSRSSSGQKEPTDINALCDEYLRLAYHGLRAKDKSFTATFETNLDPALGRLNLVPQDIGRVLLNLINNAFYTVSERAKQSAQDYKPTVKVTTRRLNDKIDIIVKDNGTGIPQNVVNKIFQPFFTTKPTGQGTGLGLSLSYDIVKAHGGELSVVTKEGEGTEFRVTLAS